MRKLVIAGLALVLAVVVTVGGAALFGWRALNEAINVPAEGLVVDVNPGVSLSRLSRELTADGVLAHPSVFVLYARLSGDATRVQAGEYLLTPDLTPLTLLEKLSSGDVIMHALTIVEGWRFSELLAGLRAHPAVRASDASGEEIMTMLGRQGLHPEGQFLPDTYLFAKGTAEIEILRRSHDALQAALDRAWSERSADIQLSTPYEALILASIIEKETALARERPLISGVFQERLRVGMRLQTDPTVIYGLGDAFDGNLRRRDLTTDTPYNTYTRHGLPPTPIALPGAAAIAAAVRPESDGSLYFVATGDPDGSHTFSKTIEEHNEAVREYVRRQRGQ